jgi:hypothetical protein
MDNKEKEIIKNFERDFNEAPTVNEGINKAFDNLPDDFFKVSYFEKIKRVIIDFFKS